MTERKCACNKLFFNSSQGPNKEKLDSQFLQTMQVGVWAPTKRNWIPNFNRQCKLGCGPQHREFRKEILQAMRVGVGRRNKFYENIISVPLPWCQLV
ncbi:hypothetical protein SA111250134_01635 [Staphylococcus aureus]|nr:hypothetical protein SA111250134_01635 [Staphylococcus aureus]